MSGEVARGGARRVEAHNPHKRSLRRSLSFVSVRCERLMTPLCTRT
jgi:hypothetical protein